MDIIQSLKPKNTTLFFNPHKLNHKSDQSNIHDEVKTPCIKSQVEGSQSHGRRDDDERERDDGERGDDRQVFRQALDSGHRLRSWQKGGDMKRVCVSRNPTSYSEDRSSVMNSCVVLIV